MARSERRGRSHRWSGGSAGSVFAHRRFARWSRQTAAVVLALVPREKALALAVPGRCSSRPGTYGTPSSWDLPPDAVLATPAKELALIAGGRKVLELDPGLPQSVFDRLLRTNGVAYLLAPTRWGDVNVYESLMSASRRCDFTEVHAVGNLRLYQVRTAPFDRDRPPPDSGPPAAGAAGFLRSARERIREVTTNAPRSSSTAHPAPRRIVRKSGTWRWSRPRCGRYPRRGGRVPALVGIRQSASGFFRAEPPAARR